jgi:hypothetical protein
VNRWLSIAIVVLAIVDALVHGYLGTRFPNGLLGTLFILNVVGYVVLVLAFWQGEHATLALRRLVDGALVVYPLVTLVAWLYFTRGRANPMNLADISKPAEVLLAVTALLHLRRLGVERRVRPAFG